MGSKKSSGGPSYVDQDFMLDVLDLARRVGGVDEMDEYAARRTRLFCRSVIMSISGLCRDKRYVPTEDIAALVVELSVRADQLYEVCGVSMSPTQPTVSDG